MTSDTKNYRNNGYKKPFSHKKPAQKNETTEHTDISSPQNASVKPKMAHFGVLTGIRYSDHDIKKNQLPECVFEAPEGTSTDDISSKAYEERLERKCSDCKGCSSYNYYL